MSLTWDSPEAEQIVAQESRRATRDSLSMWRDDLAQEMRVRLWREGDIDKWLAIWVCRCAAANFLRRERGRRGQKQPTVELLPDHDRPVDGGYDRVDDRDVLDRMRTQVTDLQWTACIAGTIPGASTAWARKRGVSQSSVNQLRKEARKKLAAAA